MESIKVYFRTALVGLAWIIITSLTSEPNPQTVNEVEDFDDLDDYHMFI